MYLLNERQVDIQDVSHDSDAVDSYFTEAYFVDNGEKLSDDELSRLTDLYPDKLQEMWFEYQVDRAESLRDYEGDSYDE